jgi:hypothetical protein
LEYGGRHIGIGISVSVSVSTSRVGVAIRTTTTSAAAAATARLVGPFLGILSFGCVVSFLVSVLFSVSLLLLLSTIVEDNARAHREQYQEQQQYQKQYQKQLHLWDDNIMIGTTSIPQRHCHDPVGGCRRRRRRRRKRKKRTGRDHSSTRSFLASFRFYVERVLPTAAIYYVYSTVLEESINQPTISWFRTVFYVECVD